MQEQESAFLLIKGLFDKDKIINRNIHPKNCDLRKISTDAGARDLGGGGRGEDCEADRGQVSLGSGLNPQLVSHPAPRNIRSLIIPYPVCGIMITLRNNISRDICCKLLCCGIIPLNNFFREIDKNKNVRSVFFVDHAVPCQYQF